MQTSLAARVIAFALLAITLLGAAVGCGGSAKAKRPDAKALRGGTVPVAVHTNALGAVIVLAPVYIRGHGPYRFVVDTGASRSIIDSRLAAALGLPVSPSNALLTGVNATTAAGQTPIRQWRIGSVPLPNETVLTLSLATDQRGPNLGGLIGSDNLSRFGSFTLNYRSGRLFLH